MASAVAVAALIDFKIQLWKKNVHAKKLVLDPKTKQSSAGKREENKQSQWYQNLSWFKIIYLIICMYISHHISTLISVSISSLGISKQHL